MNDHQQIIDTLRTFAHRTDVERVDEAVQALQQFGDEAVLALAPLETTKSLQYNILGV